MRAAAIFLPANMVSESHIKTSRSNTDMETTRSCTRWRTQNYINLAQPLRQHQDNKAQYFTHFTQILRQHIVAQYFSHILRQLRLAQYFG